MELKNVILDLDETLISSLEPLVYEKYKNSLSGKEHFIYDNFYYIFPRPGLQEFLDFVFTNYNVIIWTAASLDYALFIIQNFILIKPNRKIDYIFFNEHCRISQETYKNAKQLKQIWETFKLDHCNENNTVIIDDREDLRLNQENNVINCVPYYVYDVSTNDDLKNVEEKIKNKK